MRKNEEPSRTSEIFESVSSDLTSIECGTSVYMSAIFAPIYRKEVSHGQESQTTHCTRGSRWPLVLIVLAAIRKPACGSITTRAFTVHSARTEAFCARSCRITTEAGCYWRS